jgi:hypothetical protein
LVQIHPQKIIPETIGFCRETTRNVRLGSKNQQKSLLDFVEAWFQILCRGFNFSAASLSHFVSGLVFDIFSTPMHIGDSI